MADDLELDKTPTSDVSVNKPESGTYGEKADLARLKQTLPPMGPPGAEGTGAVAPAPTPGQTPAQSMGRPKTGPSGVPSVLMAPTQRPDVPLSQPPVPGPAPLPPKQVAADQQRLSILDALSTHPEVSEETKEWAKNLLEALIEARQ